MKTKLYYCYGSLLLALSLPFLILYVVLLTTGLSDLQVANLVQSPFFTIPVLSFIILFPVLSVRYYAKKQRLEVLEAMILSFLRYVVAFLMFYYGFAKIYGKFFEISYLTQDSRVIDVDSFNLTWYYFGKSNVQELMLGLMELVPAVLIFFRRTYFTGILLLFPVALNVLLVNVFNGISGITYLVSWIIVLDCAYIIYSGKNLIIALLKAQTRHKVQWNSLENAFRLLFKYGTIIVACYYTLLVFKVKLMPSEKTDYRNYNKHTGAYELVSLQKNGTLVKPREGDSDYKTLYFEPQSRWNSVLTFAAEYHPLNFTVNWSHTTDSVTSFLKLSNSVETERVDTASKFTGTFVFKDELLFVNGIQKHDTLNAVYKKKSLKEFKWFW